MKISKPSIHTHLIKNSSHSGFEFIIFTVNTGRMDRLMYFKGWVWGVGEVASGMDEAGMRLLNRIDAVCDFTTEVLNALIPSSQCVTVLHEEKESFCLVDVSLQAILAYHPGSDLLCFASIESQNATQLHEGYVIVDSTGSKHVVLYNSLLRDGVVLTGSLVDIILNREFASMHVSTDSSFS
jgi:hypothetical protein